MAHHYAKQMPCEACRTGHRQQQYDRRRADPRRTLARNLMGKYKLTIEKYDALLAAQGGRCAICLTDVPRDPRTDRLHVDHDHACCPGKTSCGKCIRGLLCHACNTALGNFSDDPARLQRALIYLSKGGATHDGDAPG